MHLDGVPLSRFAAVDTRSPDAARESIGRIFCPHFLMPSDRYAEGFHARHHTVTQPDYSVNFVAYGARVDIDPGELSRFFLLQIPLKGSAIVRCGTVAAEAEAGRMASLLSPTLATRMTWNDGCEKLIVLINREAMEAQFEALTHAFCRNIEFATGVDLTTPTGRTLWNHAAMMLEAAEGGEAVPDAYRVLLRDAMTTLMLGSLAGNQLHRFQEQPAKADPPAVRRAQDYMEANAGRAISMAEIAAAAGVSLRSLQDAYRNVRGVTLSEGLLAVRLDRFRASLLAGGETVSVADAAYSAGFGHLGRAAAAYRERYGESPSETLRRIRR